MGEVALGFHRLFCHLSLGLEKYLERLGRAWVQKFARLK